MPHEERFRERDRSYSAWHRRTSLARFVGMEKAQTLSMIDVDGLLYLEYDDRSRETLAMIEIAKDMGQTYKAATVTRNLARRVVPPVEAYTVLYTLSKTLWVPGSEGDYDIERFRVMQLWPSETQFITFAPKEWAKRLLGIRERNARELDKWREACPF